MMFTLELTVVLVSVIFCAFIVMLASGPDGRLRSVAFMAGWILPGAGHWLHVETADGVIQALDAWREGRNLDSAPDPTRS